MQRIADLDDLHSFPPSGYKTYPYLSCSFFFLSLAVFTSFDLFGLGICVDLGLWTCVFFPPFSLDKNTYFIAVRWWLLDCYNQNAVDFLSSFFFFLFSFFFFLFSFFFPSSYLTLSFSSTSRKVGDTISVEATIFSSFRVESSHTVVTSKS